MAVISCKEAAEHMTVRLLKGNKKEYTAPYLLTVENALDDGLDILAYFESIGRGIGSGYRYGRWTDNSVQCTQIAPQRIAGSLVHWTAVLTYSPPENSDIQRTDENGEPAPDPLDWRLEIASSTRFVQRPVWRAWNVDQMPIDGGFGGYQRAAGIYGPVVNSVGVVYDPPLTKELPETVFRITGNLAQYRQKDLDLFAGCINQNTVMWSQRLVDKYRFYAEAWAPDHVHCAGASAALRYEGGYTFYQYSYEFVFRRTLDEAEPHDFLEYVLDRGLSRRAAAGDPDGLGGTISAGDIKPGAAKVTAIRDFEGERVPEPVLLDGKGQPLSGEAEAQGVYFRWRIHPYANFTQIPITIFA